MEKKVFKFKAVISVHGLQRKVVAIIIADDKESATSASHHAFRKMCSGLCEHATHEIKSAKQIFVDAIVEANQKFEEASSN